MRCKYCGSQYADIIEKRALNDGKTEQVIYCAECKKKYPYSIVSAMPEGCEAIMTLKFDLSRTLTIASLNGKIGVLSSKGKYSFQPLEFCYFEYAKELGGVHFSYNLSIGEGHTWTRERVRDVCVEENYVLKIKNKKVYNLKEDALSGKIPTLSQDFTSTLNDLIYRTSRSPEILTNQAARRSQEDAERIKKSSGCYIATCVYGSYDCPPVWILRRYRDYTLAESKPGRAFIRAYYAISPKLVKCFGHTNWFKKLWKKILDRMIVKLQAKGVESTFYQDREW